MGEKLGVGFTRIRVVMKNNKLELAKLFLDNGADVNVKDNFGQTLLHWAVMKNKVSSVRLLLEYNADINVMHYSGQTVLERLSRNCSIVRRKNVKPRPLKLSFREARFCHLAVYKMD